jgi:hypothetical protein
MDTSVSAKILAADRSANEKTAKPLAVLPLFPTVL